MFKKLLFIVILAVLGYLFFVKQDATKQFIEPLVGPQVRIAGNVFYVDVADDPDERLLGLSNRESLGKDRGMIFLFEKENLYGFWMKGMFFPIDIVWVKGDQVAGFSENLEPDDRFDRPLYYPPDPVDKVLEINAGEVQRRGMKIGDPVEIILK